MGADKALVMNLPPDTMTYYLWKATTVHRAKIVKLNSNNYCYNYTQLANKVMAYLTKFFFVRATILVYNYLFAITVLSLSRLTTLDIVVYGHFQAILTTHLPSTQLLKILQQHQNLTMFCQRLHLLAQTTVDIAT